MLTGTKEKQSGYPTISKMEKKAMQKLSLNGNNPEIVRVITYPEFCIEIKPERELIKLAGQEYTFDFFRVLGSGNFEPFTVSYDEKECKIVCSKTVPMQKKDFNMFSHSALVHDKIVNKKE